MTYLDSCKNKQKNGKKRYVHAMSGVDRAELARLPHLRINQNYLIEVDHRFVDVVFLSQATKLGKVISLDGSLGNLKTYPDQHYRVRVGMISNDGVFQRSKRWTLPEWQLIAWRMYRGDAPINQAIEHLEVATAKAIATYPQLIKRDRSDNARYGRPIALKSKPTGELRILDRAPKAKALRALAKR